MGIKKSTRVLIAVRKTLLPISEGELKEVPEVGVSGTSKTYSTTILVDRHWTFGKHRVKVQLRFGREFFDAARWISAAFQFAHVDVTNVEFVEETTCFSMSRVV